VILISCAVKKNCDVVKLGYSQVLNRMANEASLGAVVHRSYHSSIWLQESYNKVVTVPWYTTSSVGYTYSW
jgi:hypothetical protein